MASLSQVSDTDSQFLTLDSDHFSQNSLLSQGSQEDSPDTALLEAAKLWSLAEVEMKSSDLLQVAKSVLRWRTRSCPPVREAGAALDEMTGSQDLESGRTAAAQILLLRYTIQCVVCSVQCVVCSVQGVVSSVLGVVFSRVSKNVQCTVPGSHFVRLEIVAIRARPNLAWCYDLCCFRGSPVFIPRDPQTSDGRMAESRMGEEEAHCNL